MRRQMAVEEAVAACMADEGFEYIPDVSHYTFPDEAAMDPPRDSREFAEVYGYGIVEAPPVSGSAPGANPNDAITASLGPEALARYMEALVGPSTEEADAEAEYDWRETGCMGAAIHAVWSPGAAQDPVAVDLQAEIARIDEVATPQDPSVVALDEAWSACMADAGYDGLRRQPDAAERAFESWMDAQAASASGEAEASGANDTAAEEKALAVADWDCRDQVSYDVGVAEVREELQAAYVAAHRAELDTWVETWADGASEGQ